MCNCINGFIRVSNGKVEQPACTRTTNGASKKPVLHVRLRCGSLSITTTVAHSESSFSSYYSNYRSIRTSIVATIVLL